MRFQHLRYSSPHHPSHLRTHTSPHTTSTALASPTLYRSLQPNLQNLSIQLVVIHHAFFPLPPMLLPRSLHHLPLHAAPSFQPPSQLSYSSALIIYNLYGNLFYITLHHLASTPPQSTSPCFATPFPRHPTCLHFMPPHPISPHLLLAWPNFPHPITTLPNPTFK